MRSCTNEYGCFQGVQPAKYTLDSIISIVSFVHTEEEGAGVLKNPRQCLSLKSTAAVQGPEPVQAAATICIHRPCTSYA